MATGGGLGDHRVRQVSPPPISSRPRGAPLTVEPGLGCDAATDAEAVLSVADVEGGHGWVVGHLRVEGQLLRRPQQQAGPAPHHIPPSPRSRREGSPHLSSPASREARPESWGPGGSWLQSPHPPRVPPGKWEALSPALRQHFLLSQPRWCLRLLGECPPAAVRPELFQWSKVGPPRNAPGGQTPPAHCQGPVRCRAQRPAQGGRGPCLLSYVEGVAVALGVEPAAAEGLPQNGVVGLLDPLQAVNKEACVRSWGWGTDARWDRVWTEGQREGLPAAHSPGHLQGGGLQKGCLVSHRHLGTAPHSCSGETMLHPWFTLGGWPTRCPVHFLALRGT